MKEKLSFTTEENAMSKLLLSVMGAFAEFERSLIEERQREGIALAKKAGVYKGRKPALTRERAQELSRRACRREANDPVSRVWDQSRDALSIHSRDTGRDEPMTARK